MACGRCANRPGISRLKLRVGLLALPLALFVLLSMALPQSAIAVLIPPVQLLAEWEAFKALKAELPATARVWSLWDFAVLAGDKEILKDYHAKDGVAFFPVSFFLSRGLVSGDPTELARVTRFIDEKNTAPGRWMSGINLLLKEYSVGTKATARPGDVYVLITEQMVMHFPSIYYTATWDPTTDTGEINGFDTFDCTAIRNGTELDCGHNRIDLNAGTVDGEPLLSRSDIVIGGHMERSVDYSRAGGKYLVVNAAKNGKIRHVLFLEAGHYRSNFIQMYILGIYDKDIFAETAAVAPYYRLFRLK